MAKAKNTDKLVVQNAAKTLLANIRFASVDDPIRTITVTSSIPNEGKSTVSINLAQAIATSGKSVLLVEADRIGGEAAAPLLLGEHHLDAVTHGAHALEQDSAPQQGDGELAQVAGGPGRGDDGGAVGEAHPARALDR